MMDDRTVKDRLSEIRRAVRAYAKEHPIPPVKIVEEKPNGCLTEPLIRSKLPTEPSLESTPHLEVAAETVRITDRIDLSSPRPVIGPLLTLLRRVFRPLFQPALDQYLERQEQFNHHVVQHLNLLGKRIEEKIDATAEALGTDVQDLLCLQDRVDAALESYDATLRQRHLLLFATIEEELVALDGALTTAAEDIQGEVERLRVLLTERAIAVDERFEEKDRAVEAALREIVKATESRLDERLDKLADLVDPVDLEVRTDQLELQVAEVLALRRQLQEAIRLACHGSHEQVEGQPEPDAGATLTQLGEWMVDADYQAFQAVFRGDSGELRRRLKVHLASFQGAPGIVADLGCGGGEFLELLKEKGIEAIGVEVNEAEVGGCRERGLEVDHADLFDWLEDRQSGSLGGIFMAQVIEHLLPGDWNRFVHLAASKLAPGGLLLIETINAESLYALVRAYVADPTHTRPVHPQLLAFLARRGGFHPIKVSFLSPVPAVERPIQLDVVTDDDPELTAIVNQMNDRLDRIDRLVCQDQEYALRAWMPASESAE